MKTADRAWLHGVAWALGELTRTYDQPSIAADLAGAAGIFTVKKLRDARVDGYDIEALRPVIRELKERQAIARREARRRDRR